MSNVKVTVERAGDLRGEPLSSMVRGEIAEVTWCAEGTEWMTGDVVTRGTMDVWNLRTRTFTAIDSQSARVRRLDPGDKVTLEVL